MEKHLSSMASSWQDIAPTLYHTLVKNSMVQHNYNIILSLTSGIMKLVVSSKACLLIITFWGRVSVIMQVNQKRLGYTNLKSLTCTSMGLFPGTLCQWCVCVCVCAIFVCKLTDACINTFNACFCIIEENKVQCVMLSSEMHVSP